MEKLFGSILAETSVLNYRRIGNPEAMDRNKGKSASRNRGRGKGRRVGHTNKKQTSTQKQTHI